MQVSSSHTTFTQNAWVWARAFSSGFKPHSVNTRAKLMASFSVNKLKLAVSTLLPTSSAALRSMEHKREWAYCKYGPVSPSNLVTRSNSHL